MNAGTPRTGRRLHIGGTIRAPGWEVLNIARGDHVDHVGTADDLSRFANNTFDAVYASHVLEHLSPRGQLENALREWHRVLRPRGTLYVSVPDLDVLAGLFADRARVDVHERFQIMLMIFGAHADEHDRHEIGFNDEFLRHFLAQAGFVNIRRVQSLGQFRDTSEMLFKGARISLNVIAEKSA